MGRSFLFLKSFSLYYITSSPQKKAADPCGFSLGKPEHKKPVSQRSTGFAAAGIGRRSCSGSPAKGQAAQSPPPPTKDPRKAGKPCFPGISNQLERNFRATALNSTRRLSVFTDPLFPFGRQTSQREGSAGQPATSRYWQKPGHANRRPARQRPLYRQHREVLPGGLCPGFFPLRP